MVRPDINVYMTAPINIFNYANNYDTIINDNPGKPIFVDYFFRDRAFSYDGLFGQLSVDNSRNFPNRVITSWPEDIIRGIDKANLDHFNKYTAANYYVALGMTMYGNPNQNELFKKAMDKAPDSVNLIAKYIGNYLAQLGNFTDDIPYLEEAVKWMPNDYNAVFQLILSYAVNNKQNKALELYNKLDNETKTSMKSYWTNVAASQNSPPLKDFLSKI
jgi:hypothetical protein